MSTPLVNAPPFQPPGPAVGPTVGGSISAQAIQTGPLAAFEALLAALQGPTAAIGGPSAQAVAGTGSPVASAIQAADAAQADASDEAASPDDDAQATKDGDGEDATLALLATAAAAVQAAAATAPRPAEGDQPTAGGADRVRIQVASTPVANTGADADPAAKATAEHFAKAALAETNDAQATINPRGAAIPSRPAAISDQTPAQPQSPIQPDLPSSVAAAEPNEPSPETILPVETATAQAEESNQSSVASSAATVADTRQAAVTAAPARHAERSAGKPSSGERSARRAQTATGPFLTAKAGHPGAAKGVVQVAPPAASATHIEGDAGADESPSDADASNRGAAAPPPPADAQPAAASPHSAHAPAAPVRGAPQTVANLAAQIVRKLEARSTRFDVQLDPAGLGKVDVRVEIGASGQITAALACHNPHAAKELQARSGELQRALEQAGFDLSGGLSFDVAGGQGDGTGRGPNPDDSRPVFRGRAFQASLETAADAVQTAALRLDHDRLSGVDIRI